MIFYVTGKAQMNEQLMIPALSINSASNCNYEVDAAGIIPITLQQNSY